MTLLPPDDERLARENDYLRQRISQLQTDLATATAEAERLRQVLARLHGRAGGRLQGSLSEAS